MLQQVADGDDVRLRVLRQVLVERVVQTHHAGINEIEREATDERLRDARDRERRVDRQRRAGLGVAAGSDDHRVIGADPDADDRARRARGGNPFVTNAVRSFSDTDNDPVVVGVDPSVVVGTVPVAVDATAVSATSSSPDEHVLSDNAQAANRTQCCTAHLRPGSPGTVHAPAVHPTTVLRRCANRPLLGGRPEPAGEFERLLDEFVEERAWVVKS